MRAKAKQKFERFLSPFTKPQRGGSNTASQSVSPTPSRPTSPHPSASTSPPTAPTSPTNAHSQHAFTSTDQSKQQRALELASSFQTLLSVVEKTLDGVPIWGPKAIVGAAGEVLKITKLKKDNDETIKEIQRDAAHILSIASSSGGLEGALPASTPTELQTRLDKFRDEIALHLNDLSQYQAARPLTQSSDLKERVKILLATGGELLAAEAISNALPDVNRKIAASIQKFMLVSQIKSEEILNSVNDKMERGILTQLNPVMTALHNAKRAPRTCHKGTRVAVLEQVRTWFQDPTSPSLLWLSGIAGTGKTTIAQSICEMLAAELGASFLFSRDSAERQDPSNILPTIAYQLAYSRPVLCPAICKMVSEFPGFATKSVRVQAQELMSKVLGSDMSFDFPATLLIFDALDECNKEEDQEGGDFIPLLLSFLRAYPSRFKVVLTSRPEASIRRMLEGKHGHTHLFVLHEVDKNMVQSDIETYLRYEFAQIAAKRNLGRTWTEDVREDQVKQLAALANRLFIFAATITKAVTKSRLPAAMVRSFLDSAARSSQSMYGSLDSMYIQIVKTVIPDDIDAQEAEDLVTAFQCIVGAIVALQRPLDFLSLKGLLNVEEDKLHAIIGPLYSVLDVDDSLERPIQVFHLSFPDFLADDTRCTDLRFRIVPQRAHSMISIRCLWIMNKHLERDICKIKDPSLLNSEVQDLPERLERYTSAELRYACLYWWAHLVYVDSSTGELMYEFKRFTTGRLLPWLELLSLMGQLQSAITGLPKAIGCYKRLISSNGPQEAGWKKIGSKSQVEETSEDLANISTLLYDTNRTVQAFFRPISEAALHVYESALTFMPSCTLSSQSDKLRSERVRMTSERRTQWSQDVRVMEGHKGVVRQVAVSPNGSLVASREWDGPTKLWDFASGIEIRHIETKSRNLSFSLDGSQLLSFATETGSLEVWDVVSGDRIDIFNLHLDGNEQIILEGSTYVAISPSGRHIAVGLESGNLHLFAIDRTTIQLHKEGVKAVAAVFSQDGLHIASGFDDQSVCVWDVGSAHRIATIQVPNDYDISQICISPDGFRIVVVTYKGGGNHVWIWEILTQNLVSDFEIPYYHYLSASSVNNIHFACPFDSSGALCTYDIASGRRLSVFKGHAEEVTTTAFSHGGSYVVSGSADCTIHIWDAQLGLMPSISSESPNEHNEKICDMTFSADGTKLISASDDKTICWWEMYSGRMTLQIKRGARRVGFLPSGTAVGLYWNELTIDVWNAETGEDITTLCGHSYGVRDATFSADFTQLASGSIDGTVRICITKSARRLKRID